jgi:hypothetical protein
MPDTLAPAANDVLPLSRRSELRFLACGSVDDGKLTLIGRLINDAACSSTRSLCQGGTGRAKGRQRLGSGLRAAGGALKMPLL